MRAKKHAMYMWMLLGGLAILTWSEFAGAKEVKLCTHWVAEYVDSGGPGGGAGHEDVFWQEGPVNRPAAFTNFILLKKNGSGVYGLVDSGFLDSEGCSELIDMEAGGEYQFRQGTWAGRSDGAAVYVVPDSAPWGYSFVRLISYFNVVDDFESTTGTTMELKPTWLSPKANIMPVAGRALMERFKHPAGEKTLIRTADDCYLGATWGGLYNKWSCPSPLTSADGCICAYSSLTSDEDKKAMSAGAYFKYGLGHEIGHRVARGQGFPFDTDYDDIVSSYHECTCDEVDVADGSKKHCFQSMETIGVSAAEGIAHFFAAALFNRRDDGAEGCWYSYCKQGWSWVDGVADPVLVDDPPVWHNCTHTEAPVSWLETYCLDGLNEDAGTEADWLSFFWLLYTDDLGEPGDLRYTFTDIFSLLDELSSSWDWPEFRQKAHDLWFATNPDKYYNLVDHATTAGVAHCSGGC
ncbi:MAG: hypothetical protein GY854_22560 [Deltaproteobacteria bacterium]|nr:hypothetical protein [Deltaproteobacteria bacterium]